MKRIVSTLFALPFILAFSGCGHTPVRNEFPVAVPPYTAEKSVIDARTTEFKKIISAAEIRGIMVYPTAFFGRFENRQILDIISKLGFNRIYCRLTSEQELDGNLAVFIREAADAGLPVEVVISQQDFYRRYRGNQLIRRFFIQYPDLFEAAVKVTEFNKELENSSIAGITVILTPHLFNGNNVERTRGSIYRWDKARYGIGGDNDMLMKESLEYAGKISRIADLPPLTVAVPDFFHEAAADGRLSCGTIRDFMEVSGKCAVISSANMPSKVPVSFQQELNSVPEGKKILTVVSLATHTAVDQAHLRRRNWQDFRNTMAYMMKKSGGHPAFGGVIVSPLSVIEYLRQEK